MRVKASVDHPDSDTGARQASRNIEQLPDGRPVYPEIPMSRLDGTDQGGKMRRRHKNKMIDVIADLRLDRERFGRRDIEVLRRRSLIGDSKILSRAQPRTPRP